MVTASIGSHFPPVVLKLQKKKTTGFSGCLQESDISIDAHHLQTGKHRQLHMQGYLQLLPLKGIALHVRHS